VKIATSAGAYTATTSNFTSAEEQATVVVALVP
jgi:hypothetical protein